MRVLAFLSLSNFAFQFKTIQKRCTSPTMPVLFETIRAWTVSFTLWVANVECVKIVDGVWINMCICNSVAGYSITQTDSLFSYTNLTPEFKISCQLTSRNNL
jgi:hypothetical protein